MDCKTERIVRFNDDQHSERQKQLLVFKASSSFLMPDGGISDRKTSHRTRKFGGIKVFPENNGPWSNQIVDPGSDTFLRWNRVFLFWCIVALFLDPLFFYLPSVMKNGASSCMQTDLNLEITVTCLRTFADIFYIYNILLKFKTAYVAHSSRVCGKGELVTDRTMIAWHYLRSDFFVDFVAALPLPQIVIWFMRPATAGSNPHSTNNAILLIVLLQYVPRLYLIFPLSSRIINATGVVTKTAWAGAAYNLLLYMLASHVLGASWYVLSIERQATCWKSACRQELSPVKCDPLYLDCGAPDQEKRKIWLNSTLLFNICDPRNTTFFDFGIFASSVSRNVVSSSFFKKYFYCLWWGLLNLSSYGNTLSTSTFIGETAFGILIAILGLVLFAQLIGNMQAYLQSITLRVEEWRLKRRDTEEWMRHRQLPKNLRERVRRFVQYKWIATRGVDEESILRGLPRDLRRDIRRHLCLDLVRRVQFFAQMDDQLLDAICERLVSSLSTKGTYIVREGDPVTEMIFVVRGKLESSTTNGGRTGFFNSITLRAGDFFGEELLAWALLPNSSLNLPSSTRTVRALEEVEAFALAAEDLKFVANQFRRLHSKKLQHTFRFHSHHWRTWAACSIQAAWRRYKKRKLAKSLSTLESFAIPYEEDPVADETEAEEEEHVVTSYTASQAKPDPSVTALVSRIAAGTRRGAQAGKNIEMPMLQKPEEPDFSKESEDIEDLPNPNDGTYNESSMLNHKAVRLPSPRGLQSPRGRLGG